MNRITFPTCAFLCVVLCGCNNADALYQAMVECKPTTIGRVTEISNGRSCIKAGDFAKGVPQTIFEDPK